MSDRISIRKPTFVDGKRTSPDGLWPLSREEIIAEDIAIGTFKLNAIRQPDVVIDRQTFEHRLNNYEGFEHIGFRVEDTAVESFWLVRAETRGREALLTVWRGMVREGCPAVMRGIATDVATKLIREEFGY